MAKKVLADPMRYDQRTVRVAARMAGLGWWCGDQLDFWVGLSERPSGRRRDRWMRRLHRLEAGRHDWARVDDDVPF